MFLTSLQPLTIEVQCTYYSAMENHMDKANYFNICCLFSICSLWLCSCPNLPKVPVSQGSRGVSATSSMKVLNFMFILMEWQDICPPLAARGFHAERAWFVVRSTWMCYVLQCETHRHDRTGNSRMSPALPGKSPPFSQWPSELLKLVSEGC